MITKIPEDHLNGLVIFSFGIIKFIRRLVYFQLILIVRLIYCELINQSLWLNNQ